MAYTSINKPTDYFNTVLYTGNGTTQSVTGVNFQPDWVWLKQRANDVANRNHMLFDSNRGTQKALSSNTSDAEDTSTAYLTSYDSDGFTLGGSSVLNRNTTTYASWNWLAGGTASSNTDGSITSTVSANTTSGFSIVSYTGTGSNATVGHGLGELVKCIIIKNRDQADNWAVGHTNIGFSNHLQLNITDASTGAAAVFNSTAPTSTVFSIGTNHKTNASSEDYIAYCFAEKKGFSKAFSYTGNGSTDGSYIYLGFKPMWVLFKRTDSAFGWYLYDSVRDPENQNTKALTPAESDAEQNESGIDLLSNGFKLRNADGSKNASGGSYIGIAFAENPFVTSTGIPTTAR